MINLDLKEVQYSFIFKEDFDPEDPKTKHELHMLLKEFTQMVQDKFEDKLDKACIDDGNVASISIIDPK